MHASAGQSPDAAPAGVRLAAGFFVGGGLLEVVLAAWDAPYQFWPVWDGLGRAILHWAVAAGLWRRSSLARQVAMVYCWAALILYVTVIGLALAQAPFQYPASVVVQSLYQVPSCALLLPFLRGPQGATLFARPLFGSPPRP